MSITEFKTKLKNDYEKYAYNAKSPVSYDEWLEDWTVKLIEKNNIKKKELSIGRYKD